jgi:hypothetical protein
MSNGDIRALLLTLSPSARDHLRKVLIRDQADRDEISSRLKRYRNQEGQDVRRLPDDVSDALRRVVRTHQNSQN